MHKRSWFALSMVDRICELSQKNGLSVSAVERTLGLGNGIIGKWRKQNPSCDKLKLVADYLKVSVDYLITGDDVSGTFNETEVKLIADYRLLSDQGQEYIQHQMFIAKEVYKKADIPNTELKAI